MDAVISIPVDGEFRAAVEAMANEEHRKVAQMGRVLLQEAVEARRQRRNPTDQEVVRQEGNTPARSSAVA
jgi:hypothetical protein